MDIQDYVNHFVTIDFDNGEKLIAYVTFYHAGCGVGSKEYRSFSVKFGINLEDEFVMNGEFFFQNKENVRFATSYEISKLIARAKSISPTIAAEVYALRTNTSNTELKNDIVEMLDYHSFDNEKLRRVLEFLNEDINA